jgi:hypothetical protein
MKRTGLTFKDCFGCQEPTQTVPESVRVICAICTQAGVRFPRDVQTELFTAKGAAKPTMEGAGV